MKRICIFLILLMQFSICIRPDIDEIVGPPSNDNKVENDTTQVDSTVMVTPDTLLVPIIGNVIVGYVTHWEKTMPEPALVTHINYSYAESESDFAELVIKNEGRLDQIVSLKSKYPKLKVMLSIGGWSSESFNGMVADSIHRKNFTKCCLDAVMTHNLDGIDLSLPDDTKDFTILLEELRKSLGKHRQISMTSSAEMEDIDFKTAVRYLDFVNIMAYDMGRPPYHNAALYPSSSACLSCSEVVEQYFQAGLPYEKMVLGMPFYGHGNGIDYDDVIDFKDVPQKELSKKGLVKCWDESAMVPYLENTSGEMVITYDDESSIGLKADFVKAKGLRGAMYWNLEADDYAWTLAKAVSTRLLDIDETDDEEVGVYQVTNAYVQDFIDQVTYTDRDYSYTYVYNFPGGGPGRADLPQPVILKWKEKRVASLKVWTEGWSREYDIEAGQTKQEIVNLVPNVTYTYALLDKVGNTLKENTFKTTGSVHQVFFPHEVRNSRDIGGWKTLNGKTVAYRKLYRGGAVGGLINAKGKEEWRAEGIKAELDLREASSSPAVSPVGEDIDYLRPGFPGGYKGMVSEYQPGVRQCFEFIAQCLREDKPVFYHCTAGRDRTGTMTVLILGLLGVSEGDISKEYELTYFAPEDWSIWLSRDPDKFLHTRSLKGYFDSTCKYIWSFGAPTFQGCVENYLLSIGVTQKDIDDIRVNMLLNHKIL